MKSAKSAWKFAYVHAGTTTPHTVDSKNEQRRPWHAIVASNAPCLFSALATPRCNGHLDRYIGNAVHRKCRLFALQVTNVIARDTDGEEGELALSGLRSLWISYPIDRRVYARGIVLSRVSRFEYRLAKRRVANLKNLIYPWGRAGFGVS